jgi:hypothetical protein
MAVKRPDVRPYPGPPIKGVIVLPNGEIEIDLTVMGEATNWLSSPDRVRPSEEALRAAARMRVMEKWRARVEGIAEATGVSKYLIGRYLTSVEKAIQKAEAAGEPIGPAVQEVVRARAAAAKGRVKAKDGG